MHHLRRSRRVISIVMMICSLALPGLAAASTAADNANALIAGGCISPTDCSNKVHNGDATVRNVFHANGVTAIMINQAVPGTVTKTGQVMVNGKTVATHAMSFGRTNLPGSTPFHGAFRRPTSVSFASSQLPAFVHMTNGRFDFAVIESCGNLVVATPVVMASKPVTKTVTPAPAPAPVVNVVQVQAQTQSQTQPTPTPAPAQMVPTPTPPPQPIAAAAALPQTGAGTIGLGGLSTLLVFAAYYLRSRRGLHLALRRG